MDQGSTWKRSAVHNFAPRFTKFCVMWEGLSLPREGLSLPHDANIGNSRDEIVDRGWFLFDAWSMDQADLVW